ncbi:unnamed protein product [Linum tenue]|uniref:Glutathione S-transferase n=1 Tax=Linum tenue TaxID=586396 RepID=A0AAV0MPR8_9ROSI|nr:unnamed protein product [Linum tenue]
MEKDHIEDEVVLFGSWSSSICTRVHIALKQKGIAYKYVEEDLQNKSQSLLSYNPVHKKVPVLVHNGKPIPESLLILEYIDEFWKDSAPMLLPGDPHHRAKVRFWAKFHDEKMAPNVYKMIFAKGDKEQVGKAVAEFDELLTVFEQGVQNDFPAMFPSVGEGHQAMGFLEIVAGVKICIYEAVEATVGPVFDTAKHPAFTSWVNALKELPLMKEHLPLHDKLVARIKIVLDQA